MTCLGCGKKINLKDRFIPVRGGGVHNKKECKDMYHERVGK